MAWDTGRNAAAGETTGAPAGQDAPAGAGAAPAGSAGPSERDGGICAGCDEPMTWFTDHWVCVNYKLHDKVVASKKNKR